MKRVTPEILCLAFVPIVLYSLGLHRAFATPEMQPDLQTSHPIVMIASQK